MVAIKLKLSFSTSCLIYLGEEEQVQRIWLIPDVSPDVIQIVPAFIIAHIRYSNFKWNSSHIANLTSWFPSLKGELTKCGLLKLEKF